MNYFWGQGVPWGVSRYLSIGDEGGSDEVDEAPGVNGLGFSVRG